MLITETMTLGESITVSLLGISVVMTALILLALMTLLFSKSIALIGIGNEKKTDSRMSSQINIDDVNEEELAVLMAAVSEESNMAPEKFRIVEIKELK
ncbi:MAG: OadG family transporter subunit [Proteocatella sp.]